MGRLLTNLTHRKVKMKTKTYKSLGLNVNLSVPETVEEFDTNAKRIGACLEEATNNCVYRGSLTEFRSNLCDKVESTQGVERKTKDTGKKDSEGKAILAFDESEADFIERVVATKGIKVEDLQPIADEVANAIVFDASARERKAPTPKKLAAKYSANAKAIIDQGKVDAFNKKASKLIDVQFTATGDAAKDVEALGWIVKQYVEAVEAQQMAALVG